MNKLPVVMPANRGKVCRGLHEQFPGRVAMMMSQNSWRNPHHIPYVLDNERFSVWSKGKTWDAGEYKDFLYSVADRSDSPEWAAVPDVVCDPVRTFRWWDRWSPFVSDLGFPLAIVVQNGMTPKEVRKCGADVVFVGGDYEWKWKTLRMWCAEFPRVHVGRVNTGRCLWRVHKAGGESSDGTGWRFIKQHLQLIEYLRRSSEGLTERNRPSFNLFEERR